MEYSKLIIRNVKSPYAKTKEDFSNTDYTTLLHDTAIFPSHCISFSVEGNKLFLLTLEKLQSFFTLRYHGVGYVFSRNRIFNHSISQ